MSKGGKPIVPASVKPYKLLIFDSSGRSVYTDTCSFKPDLPYVKQMLPLIVVRLFRRGKKGIKDYSIGVMECSVTMLGRVEDFLKVE